METEGELEVQKASWGRDAARSALTGAILEGSEGWPRLNLRAVLVELLLYFPKIPRTVAFQWGLNTSTVLTQADLCFLGGCESAQSHPLQQKKKKKLSERSTGTCDEVKKWAENENTGCCQCFPNDCSVVWQCSRRLLGPRPIHLCLGSSLSNAIWPSEAIVSLMWQPQLGCIYLFSLRCEKNKKEGGEKHPKHIMIS